MTESPTQAIQFTVVDCAFLKTPPVSAFDFFEGQVPREFLQTRVGEICQQNPWLCGRLKTIKGKLSLVYQKSPVELPLTTVDIPGLNPRMSFSEVSTTIRPYLVKFGNNCLDKDEPLARFVVAKISENSFAVIFSMCHMLGDGHTFYEIRNMLSASGSVIPLIIDRHETFSDDLTSISPGLHEWLPWLYSPGVLMTWTCSVMFGRSPAYNMFTVNQEYINEQKTAYKVSSADDPAFVSSNDVITSDYWRLGDCDVTFMVVNFRNRIPHITSQHAGNYEAPIAFQRPDFDSPQLIRRALKSFHRVVSGKLPGFYKSLGVKFGVVSSWATFYRDMDLPGCKLTCHMPLIEITSTPFEQYGVLFKFNEQETGIVTICKDPTILNDMKILKEKLI